jgi:Diguanylate cyclase, GGDEF domain
MARPTSAAFDELSLVIIDVDDFKKINDRQGHLQGDLVLEAVAGVVRESTARSTWPHASAGMSSRWSWWRQVGTGRRPWASGSPSGCGRRGSRRR